MLIVDLLSCITIYHKTKTRGFRCASDQGEWMRGFDMLIVDLLPCITICHTTKTLAQLLFININMQFVIF
jgi:hypothetical protein